MLNHKRRNINQLINYSDIFWDYVNAKYRFPIPENPINKDQPSYSYL